MERKSPVVSNSTGVQVGDDNVQVFFSDPRKRRLAIITAVCTVLVLVGMIVLINRTIARADLELSAFAVQKPSKVAADGVDVSTGEVTPGKEVDATAIDITLKNNGSAPAVLTSLIVKVKYAKTLQDCNMRGGESRVSAAYTVRLPELEPGKESFDAPFELKKDIRFEVRGGAVDRFTLTIGPSLQTLSSTTPWVVVGDVELVRDDGTVLPAGTAAVVTQAGQGLENLSVAPVEQMDCIRGNASKIDEVFEIPAARTDELDTLRNRYAKLATASASESKETCGREVQAAMSKVCASLAGTTFEISVQLAAPPRSGSSGMVFRLRDNTSALTSEWAFNYQRDYSGKLGWQYDSRGDTSIWLQVVDGQPSGTRVVLTGKPSVDLLLADNATLTAEWVGGANAVVTYPDTLVIPRAA